MFNLQQNTSEWLDFRKNKIGASDIPIILGISPYCTPYDLWRKKLGFAEPEKETMVQRRGKDLEPKILEHVNNQGDFLFSPQVVEHKDLHWAIASLDGLDDKKHVVLEIKCTSKKNHEMIRLGNCPDIYYPQIQWQLFVSGCNYAILAHYFDNETIQTSVRRDDIYIESTLIPKAADFYRCMCEFIPPEMLERDYVQITDPNFQILASEWIELKQEKDRLEAKEKALRKQMLDFTDDGNAQGFGITLRKKKRQGSIAWENLWKDLCEKYHADLQFDPETYRKSETVFWEIKEGK